MGLKKNYIRSIRFSEELLEIINQQVGNNFTEKFERLVYNCYMLAAAKREEAERIDKEIVLRRKQLEDYRVELQKLMPVVHSIKRQLTSVDSFLEDYIDGNT